MQSGARKAVKAVVQKAMARHSACVMNPECIDGKCARMARDDMSRQICFCTDRALETLKFSGSEEVSDG